MPGHVIWDWNGTLLDDFQLCVDAARFAAARVRPAVQVSAESYRRWFTRPVRLFYERLVGGPVSDDEWLVLVESFHDYYNRGVSQVPLRAGAIELVTELHGMGVTQSVLSMSAVDPLTAGIRQHGLGDWLLFVDGAPIDKQTGSKQAMLADHLIRVRRARPDLTHRQIAMVGDTTDDAVAAVALGIAPVIMHDGCFDEHELRALQASVATDLAGAIRLGLPHLSW